MPETFVPLREWLRPSIAVPTPPPPPPPQPEAEIRFDPVDDDNVMRDVRLFRAALRESLDACVQVLAREIAVEVVSRELELAPADITSVVERAIARYTIPLSIRVHPDEVACVRDFEGVVADASVRRGDVILAVCGGTIDASLGVRLARVLAAVGS
jgi:flagellar biosynthesis/type III secretory pathway protein FliH